MASKGNHSSTGLSLVKEKEGHSQKKYFGENQRSMKCTVGIAKQQVIFTYELFHKQK